MNAENVVGYFNVPWLQHIGIAVLQRFLRPLKLPDGVLQALQNKRVYRFGLDVTISFCIKCVAFP